MSQSAQPAFDLDQAECRWMHTRRGRRLVSRILKAWKGLYGPDILLRFRDPINVQHPMGKIAVRAVFDRSVYREYWGLDLFEEIDAIQASLRP